MTQSGAEFVYNRRKSEAKKIQNGCCLTSGVMCLIVLIGIPVTFFTVGATIYKDYIPTTGRVNIPNEHILLLGEFDPFYVQSITLISYTDTHFYQIQCQRLSDWVNLRTIQHFKQIRISHQNTYQVYDNYLAEGSLLHFTFGFRNVTFTPGCQIYIYTFNDIALYVSFLKHGTRSGFITKQCLQSGSHTFTAEHTEYHFFGLYIADTSVLESVNVRISGYELYFNIGQNQPDCVTVSGLRISCTLQFERQHIRDNNICILGSTPNRQSLVTYETKGNNEVRKVRIAIIVIGLVILFSVSLPCVSCCTYISIEN